MAPKYLLALALVAPLALTGCRDTSRDDYAAPIDSSVKALRITDQYRGLSDDFRGDKNTAAAKATIYWVDGRGSQAALVTYGSSSCPSVPEKVQVVSATRINLIMKPDPSGACTADLGPYTTEFRSPNQLNLKQPIRVALKYPGRDGQGSRMTLTLPPPDGYVPKSSAK
jgi:hypothetical protein